MRNIFALKTIISLPTQRTRNSQYLFYTLYIQPSFGIKVFQYLNC